MLLSRPKRSLDDLLFLFGFLFLFLLGLSTFLFEIPLDMLPFIIFFPPKKNLRNDTHRKTLQTITFDILKDVLHSPCILDL
jgi:hypothetical protein